MGNYAKDVNVALVCIIETGGINEDNRFIIQFEGFRNLDNVGAGLKSSPNAKVRAANEIDE
jgi:hypothetical protein